MDFQEISHTDLLLFMVDIVLIFSRGVDVTNYVSVMP